MKSFKVIIKRYENANGISFFKASAKGEFLPLVTLDVDKYYTIKFTGAVEMPQKEGVFAVACDDNGLWLDTREAYVEKNIVRVRATRVMFEKSLTK